MSNIFDGDCVKDAVTYAATEITVDAGGAFLGVKAGAYIATLIAPGPGTVVGGISGVVVAAILSTAPTTGEPPKTPSDYICDLSEDVTDEAGKFLGKLFF